MTEYVFSYKSVVLPIPWLVAIHCTRHALNSRVSNNNTHSLNSGAGAAVLLIFIDQHHFGLSYNMSKGAEIGHVMLQ